jgi:multiple sugar transport system permease protein
MSKALTWVRRFFQRARKVFFKAVMVVLLVDIAFIFVMPLLRVLSTSLMNIMDMYDPTVVWIPRRWSPENYWLAFVGLVYFKAFSNSFLEAAGAAVLQTISCAIVGYGFARFRFPGRDKLFMLVLFAMIVPPHAIIIQLFILFRNLPNPLASSVLLARYPPFLGGSGNWLDTYLPFYVPAAIGMGLRGALFVFIFRQFFKGMPWELEDAALIDGAGPFRLFLSVMLPPAQPAILVVFLFSFVWHWNDSLEPAIYLSTPAKYLMMQRLAVVEQAITDPRYRALWGTGMIMSAAMLVILPLLLLYVFAQRHFVESIERTGLIG